MDAEKWKGLVKKAFPRDKTVKLLVALGLCGVVLIYLSSLLGGEKRKAPEAKAESAQPGALEYGAQLEEDLIRVVRAITGEEAPTVLVTLENGGRTVYAADEKISSQTAGEETQGESETAHVVLKDSDGAQHALAVTELQPEIKGVVIVSRFAGDPVVREKLTDAARTALNVSSAKVCVTDSG